MIALTKGQSQWGFACGRISVLTGQLMPYDYYLALAGLERVEEMFHRLQDTSLREHMFPGAITWEDWSTIIDAYVDDLIASLRHDCPEPVLADMFALSEDYLNLKRAVLNRTPFQFVPGVFRSAPARGGVRHAESSARRHPPGGCAVDRAGCGCPGSGHGRPGA